MKQHKPYINRSYVQGLGAGAMRKPDPPYSDHGKCPRCGNMVIIDMLDLACIACGWRESCYFKQDDDIDQVLLQRLAYNNLRLAPV